MLMMVRGFLFGLVVCLLVAVDLLTGTAVATETISNVAKESRLRLATSPILTAFAEPQDDDDDEEEEEDKPQPVTVPAARTPIGAPSGASGQMKSPKKTSAFNSVLDLFTGRRPEIMKPLGPQEQPINAWTNSQFDQAAVQRSSKLNEALTARAAKSNDSEFVALLKQLLDTAASSRPSVPVAAVPAPAPVSKPAVPQPAPNRKRPLFNQGLIAPGQPPTSTVPTPGPQSPVSGEAPLTDHQFVQVIVRHLTAIDADDAWAALQDILSGSQQTPVDLKQSSIVVFEQVFGSPDLNATRAEQLAVSVVNQADTSIPAQELLNTLAIRAARSALHLSTDAQEAGREADVNKTLKPPTSKPVIQLGGRDDEDEDEEERPVPSGVALPNNPAPPVETPLKLTPESLAELVPVIHSESLATAVAQHLEASTNLADAQQTLTLASMLPNIDLRHSMFTFMDDHRAEGADMLLSGAMYQPVERDPGHLLVLKSLVRPRRPRPGRTLPAPSAADVSWARATWEVVRTLTDHLSKASSDPELAWEGPLPLRLHRGAVPEVSIQITIPDGFQGTEETPAGTRVFYTRCTVTPTNAAETRQLAQHYEERTNGVRRALKEQGVLWFDGIRGGDDGTRMTMDVVIRKAAEAGQPAFGGAAGPGQRFTIEAVTVIAADPRESLTADEPTESEAPS